MSQLDLFSEKPEPLSWWARFGLWFAGVDKMHPDLYPADIPDNKGCGSGEGRTQTKDRRGASPLGTD